MDYIFGNTCTLRLQLLDILAHHSGGDVEFCSTRVKQYYTNDAFWSIILDTFTLSNTERCFFSSHLN